MATTPNYSFSVYSSTDTDVRFLDFRVATAGSQSTSNFYVIDTVLKQHSDAIDSINATPSAFVVKGTYSSGSLYTASVANYPGYKNEQLIVLSLNQKNTGAVQININGTTNKDVMKYGSDGVLKAVEAGDFVANSPVLCLYDGTRFVVIGITSASSITATGEAGDILQIADDGTIESSGKKAAQPNGIATLDENGNVVQVANMANSAAAVYSGAPVSIAYAGAQRIASITAYGENAQGGTTEAPVALTGVDSAILFGQHAPVNLAKPEALEVKGISVIPNADGSVTVKGTATDETWPRLVRVNIPSAIIAGDIAISLSSPASVKIYFQVMTPDGRKESYGLSAGSTSITVKIKSGYTNMHIFLSLLPDQTIDETFHIMIVQGTEPVPFVPYVDPSITHLPISRPLHKVGDVRDVCRTRVKSKWDKSLQVESSKLKKNSANAYQYYINTDTEDVNRTVEPGCNKFIPSYTAGISAFSGGFNFWMKGVLEVDDLEHAKAWFDEHPTKVFYQSTAYDGTNGLDVCLTEYQTGFVELDVTENVMFEDYGKFKRLFLDLNSSALSRYSLEFSHGEVGAIPTIAGGLAASFNEVKLYRLQILGAPDTWTTLGVTDTTTAKTWLAAQKAAGTPVQVAYQLATPETYATDPVDFDNAAGPLTVVTGGQVEVKMTDFVTDRTPAFLNKLDKTGDGSDVTVTFTEAATDTDIASGDKLSILFGKILKRFSTITSKFTTVDNSITQIESDISDITDGTTVVAQANKVTNALVIMSNSGTALVNYDGSATANMTLSPSNVGAEPAFTKNTAFNKNFGSSAGTVCQGNDGRLSNARRSSNISMSLSGTNLSISYS
jgi:hypothetical protein